MNAHGKTIWGDSMAIEEMFHPNIWFRSSRDIFLWACIQIIDGDAYAVSAFFDRSGSKVSSITKGRVKESRYGHLYFTRSRDRYYIREGTTGSPPFNRVD